MAHLLAPIDTLAEVIFSVLILLTFTPAFRIFMGLSVTLDIRPDGWRRGKEEGEG